MVIFKSVIERPNESRDRDLHNGFPKVRITCQHCSLFGVILSQAAQLNPDLVDIRVRWTHPTLPSSEIEISFCASTANSIGSCCSTSFTKPLTTRPTASSCASPRCTQKNSTSSELS